MAVTDIASMTYNHGWRLDPIVRSGNLLIALPDVNVWTTSLSWARCNCVGFGNPTPTITIASEPIDS
jgi:hypothetical protein